MCKCHRWTETIRKLLIQKSVNQGTTCNEAMVCVCLFHSVTVAQLKKGHDTPMGVIDMAVGGIRSFAVTGHELLVLTDWQSSLDLK